MIFPQKYKETGVALEHLEDFLDVICACNAHPEILRNIHRELKKEIEERRSYKSETSSKFAATYQGIVDLMEFLHPKVFSEKP